MRNKLLKGTFIIQLERQNRPGNVQVFSDQQLNKHQGKAGKKRDSTEKRFPGSEI
jgi:hypothetical protein